jgi:hypothetical protein
MTHTADLPLSRQSGTALSQVHQGAQRHPLSPDPIWWCEMPRYELVTASFASRGQGFKSLSSTQNRRSGP